MVIWFWLSILDVAVGGKRKANANGSGKKQE